jgi:N-acetyl-alpha-D-glucosaminyl L-malate synthase BshA
MKIGITCYPTYGGSGIVATELGMELAARGHEVHFISYANPIRLDPDTPRIHYHEVEVTNYPLFHYPPYCLALASRMMQVAEQYELDLLHVHYAIPHSISAMLAQQMLAGRRKLPFITTLHGTDITLVGTDPSYLPITKFSMEKSDGVTAISSYLKHQTMNVFGVSNEVRVIHNFINSDLYRPDAARQDSQKILLHISNFRPVKRVLDCIRIFGQVRRQVPETALWMVGDGPDRTPAERLARELGLEGSVRFLGKQNHVERLIPQGHILLMPSELEAFGLAALEGMACGLPPISTNAGGVPELITHEVDGFVEKVGDVNAQAMRAIELLKDESLYGRMARAARQTAVERFATSQVIPQYEQYYRDVLAR